MKKYKNSEVFAMLEKNPKLKFKFQDEFSLYVQNDKVIIRNDLNGSTDFGLYLDDVWELIEEPISFNDAVVAFNNGKTIKCILKEELSGGDIITTYKKTMHCKNLKDSEGYPLSPDEVLKGKWYIEE